MTIDEAKEIINSRINCRSFLSKARNGGYICPICHSGMKTNGTGAVKFYEQTNTWWCHACHAGGDVIKLYQEEKNVDFRTAVQELGRSLNLEVDSIATTGRTNSGGKVSRHDMPIGKEETQPPKEELDFSEYYEYGRKQLEKFQEAIDYLKERGISLETARKFGLGFDPEADPAAAPGGKGGPKRHATGRIIIPCGPHYYVARRIDGQTYMRYAAPIGTPLHFFNEVAIGGETPVFVVEGAFDALAVIEAGGVAVAMNSGAAKLFVEFVEKNNNEAHETPELLLSMDNDDAGEKFTATLEGGLKLQGLQYTVVNLAGKCKDCGERIQKDRQGLIDAVNDALKGCSGTGDLEKFFFVAASKRYEPVPTGIDKLDEKIEGGLVNETLVLVSGAPGSGKTAICTQIAENLARRKKSVLYLNFEMSRDQLIARSLARLMVGNICLSATQILRLYERTESEMEAIYRAGAAYKQWIEPHLQYNPGNVSPYLGVLLKALERQAEMAEESGRVAPIVCCDYLQLLQGDQHEDRAATIGRAMTGLKDYAVKHHTIVLGITAQNRLASNSNEARMDAGRDTSNLEYGSDLILQIKEGQGDQQERLIYVTKSRFSQASLKDPIVFRFHGRQSMFE